MPQQDARAAPCLRKGASNTIHSGCNHRIVSCNIQMQDQTSTFHPTKSYSITAPARPVTNQTQLTNFTSLGEIPKPLVNRLGESTPPNSRRKFTDGELKRALEPTTVTVPPHAASVVSLEGTQRTDRQPRYSKRHARTSIVALAVLPAGWIRPAWIVARRKRV